MRGNKVLCPTFSITCNEWLLELPNEAQQASSFELHHATLDFMYFQRAQDRLASLQRWAEGRVTHERAEKEKPKVGEN